MKITTTKVEVPKLKVKDINNGVPYKTMGGGYWMNVSGHLNDGFGQQPTRLMVDLSNGASAYPLTGHNGNIEVEAQYPDHELVLRKG